MTDPTTATPTGGVVWTDPVAPPSGPPTRPPARRGRSGAGVLVPIAAVLLVAAAAGGFYAVHRRIVDDGRHEAVVDRAHRAEVAAKHAAAAAAPGATDWANVVSPGGDLTLDMPAGTTRAPATVPDAASGGDLHGNVILSGTTTGRSSTCFEGDLLQVVEATSYDLEAGAAAIAASRGMNIDTTSSPDSSIGRSLGFSAHSATQVERGFLVISSHWLVVLLVVDPASQAADAEHVLLRMVGSLSSR